MGENEVNRQVPEANFSDRVKEFAEILADFLRFPDVHSLNWKFDHNVAEEPMQVWAWCCLYIISLRCQVYYENRDKGRASLADFNF